ncbi:MAG: hypothetical protein AB1571_00740 [Nanoarchaeota archaeon]
MLKEKLYPLYDKHHKKTLIFPIIIILLSILIIGYKYYTTGDFIEKDVSLKGGISATIYTENEINVKELKSFLTSKFPNADIAIRKLGDFSTGKQVGISIDATNIKSDDLKIALQENLQLTLTDENLSVEEIGSSLSQSFYKEILYAVLIAFLFMGIVIFIIFRLPIPSLTVILCAFTDIIATVAVVDLLGIKLSMGGIAAFLMLIGYSVDTDILLTTRVLKRKEGTLFDRMYEASKPGLTMTITTIVAVFIGYLLATSAVMQQIFLIIFIGGIWDIFNTWITNTSILYWYCKKKGVA